jgi:AcrR family transcriptional regulator
MRALSAPRAVFTNRAAPESIRRAARGDASLRAPERPGARSDLRRAEILRSAAAAFRRRGYHGASMGEIARAVGMTKGNLYYYFRNKEEILYFCHDYSLDILLARLRQVQRAGGPPDLRLRSLLVAFVHMIIDELHGTALTLDLDALSAAHRRQVVAKRDRFDHALRRILRRGMRTRRFAAGDPKLLTFALLGAVNWITRWFDPAGPARSGEIAETFAEYLLAGLAPSRRGRPHRLRAT